MKHILAGAALGLGLLTVTATAQDMMRGVDLSSPDMVSAEMTRAQVEATIATATTAPADFTGKRLSNLDLSGLDLSRAIFRNARLNKTRLANADLDHAVLDQAWLLEADLTGRQAERCQPVCRADGPCTARRRRPLEGACCRRPDRREPRRSLDRGCAAWVPTCATSRWV